MKTDIATLSHATGVPTARLQPFMDALVVVIKDRELNTPQRLAGFLAQAVHESAYLSRLVESLDYEAERLAIVWPGRFALPSDKPNTAALTIGRTADHPANQHAIADAAYGGRMGNRPGTGDGWDYRGRGVFQLTGRSNYAACSTALGMDFVNSPDQLATPAAAMLSAGWFWANKQGNRFCDAGDIDGLSRAINGGNNGLLQRAQHYRAILSLLSA